MLMNALAATVRTAMAASGAPRFGSPSGAGPITVISTANVTTAARAAAMAVTAAVASSRAAMAQVRARARRTSM
jgi:hypothetical protein